VTRYFLLWLVSTSLAAALGWTVGRMTAPGIQAAFLIECDSAQMERVQQLARNYREQGMSLINALTKARLEECL